MFGKFEEAYLKVIKECDENISECDKTPIKECGDKAITECGDEEVTTESAKKVKRKVVKFFTEDPTLIDALQSGFDSVIIAVKGEDDEEGDEITFGPEVFEEVSIEDEPADADMSDTDEAEDGDEEFNESITGAAGGAIAGGMVGGPVGALAGGLLGSNL